MSIGIPIHFHKGSGIVTFSSIELCMPLEVSRDVRPPVQMRRGPSVYSSISTQDSDLPSSGQRKDEPAFKPLQGYPTFLRFRASRGPFPMGQKTQGPSHIPLAEGKLLLRCFWKVGLPLQSKTGTQLSSWTIWGAWSFPRVAVLKLIFI